MRLSTLDSTVYWVTSIVLKFINSLHPACPNQSVFPLQYRWALNWITRVWYQNRCDKDYCTRYCNSYYIVKYLTPTLLHCCFFSNWGAHILQLKWSVQVPLIQMWIITHDPTDWAAYATVVAGQILCIRFMRTNCLQQTFIGFLVLILKEDPTYMVK